MQIIPLVTVSLCALLLAVCLGWCPQAGGSLSPDANGTGSDGPGSGASALHPVAGPCAGKEAQELEESLQPVDGNDPRARADRGHDGGAVTERILSLL